MSEATPFERIGGAAPVQALAVRFYALLDSDPAYAPLRAVHGPDLAPIAVSLGQFLTAWLGGPRDWFAERPGTCIMRMHRLLGFPPALADQWASAMRAAIAADPALDTDLGRQIGDTLTRMAHAMAVAPEG
ncbi:globin [Sphingomonas sp. HITSZ_GF]|uniref:globin domain-containing protein n=1 Tax=Sphingomonas sp. HITSZ_GF TaxID=3037247 RepID=UPI00240E5D52|nr:globin [Sphingomonas sp. HITSZ_GF]MDG2535674.1 globin [Sphingomonas sp. HITSZ_GF]